MKDKILFFTDTWFVNFGIAKILQYKCDCDMFAIIDADFKARKFFDTQKLTRYKKIWHYLDFVSKTGDKPDLSYLKAFEEKYKIDLWSVAYTDRDFYKYNSFYRFSANEILVIIEKECRFFEKVLDEVSPDFLSMINPTSHYHQLLYLMCKARGIKILMLSPVRFANRLMISQDAIKIDKLKTETIGTSTRTIVELQNYLKRYDTVKQIDEMKKVSFESKTFQRYKAILKFFLSNMDKNYKSRYSNFGKTKFKVLTTKISNFIRKKYRNRFIDRFLLKNIDLGEKFIYFPLHYEPERVTLIDAPFYTSQISVIINISKSLPIEYFLYVKEHPAMKILGWRNTSFYNEIMKLPNVRLFHPSVSSDEMIKKSSLVITIAGTTGQEAVFYNKPVILFTAQLYDSLLSVYKIKKLEELPQAIRKCLEIKVDIEDLDRYVEFVDKNTFELNLTTLSSDFAYRFGFKGPVMDAELPEDKVEQFLNDYEKEFDLLTNEHLKKIKQHKEGIIED